MLCFRSDLALDHWLGGAIVVSMSGAALTVGAAIKRLCPPYMRRNSYVNCVSEIT
jgi:hypothetical protein